MTPGGQDLAHADDDDPRPACAGPERVATGRPVNPEPVRWPARLGAAVSVEPGTRIELVTFALRERAVHALECKIGLIPGLFLLMRVTVLGVSHGC